MSEYKICTEYRKELDPLYGHMKEMMLHNNGQYSILIFIRIKDKVTMAIDLVSSMEGEAFFLIPYKSVVFFSLNAQLCTLLYVGRIQKIIINAVRKIQVKSVRLERKLFSKIFIISKCDSFHNCFCFHNRSFLFIIYFM